MEAPVKKYRSWMFVLFIVALMLGSSLISPIYSEANKVTIATTEADQQEVASDKSLQSFLDSREPVKDPYLGRFSLNVARRGHTSVALSDGRVAIIGGQNETGTVGEVEVLNAQSPSIEVVATLRVPRSRPTATLLADGRVLVAGGWDRKDLFDSTEIFNPETNSISRGPKLRRPRAAHLATVLRDGRILITGGTPDASAEVFDPSTNSTTLLKAKMTAARSFHAAALLDNGNVLLVGGVDQDGQSLRSAEIFDVSSQTFNTIHAPMRIKRVRATLHTLPNGKVQVIGGDADGTMEVYDPARNKFAAAAHLAPTAGIFPTSKTLQSRARAALIDSKIALDDSAKTDPTKPLHHYSSASKTSLDSFDELLARTDYSSAEVPGANRTVIAGGVGKSGEYVRSVVLVESSSATITTDQAEYEQGERPIISGSGWKPHEIIHLVRQEARPGHRRKPIEVVADESGNFTSGDIPVEAFQSGVTYTLTAMGTQSAYVAQTSYSDARLPGQKPKTGKLSMPILFRDASFEHEEGLIVWDMQTQSRPGVRPPEIAAVGGDAETFDFTDIEDKPCFGVADICPFPQGIDVLLKSDSFITFSGAIDGDLLAGDLKVSESINGKLIFQVTAEQYDLPPFPIPGASREFRLVLGDFEIALTIGIVARIRLEFEDPGTIFTTTFNFDQNAAVHFTDKGITPSGDLDASVEFDLVQTAGGGVRLSVGPEIGIEATISGDVCDFGVEAAANMSPFIRGRFIVENFDTCPTYKVDFNAGIGALVEGTVSFCIFDIEGGADTDFFALPLPFTFSGNLNDTTPPTIACPDNITQGTDGSSPSLCGTTVNFSPTASDGQCAAPTVACTPASGSFFNKGTTTVTCIATDGGGNQSPPCSFNVIVNDDDPPSAQCPSNITDSNTQGQCGKTISYDRPITSDNCGTVAFSCKPESGSFFPVGTTTVTCSFKDETDNQSTCSFTVTINDTEKPTIACPGPITKGTDLNVCMAVVNFNPTASDNCALPKNAVVCSPSSGTAFAKGTTTVNCSVTDGVGLMASCSFTVTINDTQGPSYVCPANVIVGTTPNLCTGVATYLTPTATDNCGGSPVVTCSPASGLPYPKGVTTVTCSSKDSSNNTTMCSFTVTVNDTQAPAISCPTAQTRITARPGDASVAVSYPTATGSDNCPGVVVTCSPPSGSAFPVGTTTVSCTATDQTGNSTTCSFTMTVFDVCLQDETTPAAVLLWNSRTGDYRYCCTGSTYSGRGTYLRKGNIFTLSHVGGAQRVNASLDASANRGTSSLQVSGVNRCPITDRDISNNTWCQ
jgi:hypothetical protein